MLHKVILGLVLILVGVWLINMSPTLAKNVVTMNSPQEIGSIDPATHTTLFPELVALENLYDALYYPGENGKLLPQIAKSYELSEDGLTYTFTLRSGVIFHDGTEVTAEDVAYSMERQLAINQGVSWMWSSVNSVKVIDKYHVAFHLRAPDAEFMLSIPYMYIVNKRLVEKHSVNGDYGKGWLKDHEAGSGPYTLKSWIRGTEFVMEKFDKYSFGWPDNPVDEVRMIIIHSPATVVTMMKAGKLNMTDEWLPFAALQTLRRTEGLKIADQPSSNAFYLALNTKRAPTDDIHVRKALAWAFDYKACTTIISPGSVQLQGPVPSFLPGHDDKVFQYHRDLSKAQEELEKSKYYPNIPTIELAYWQPVEEERRMALMLQASMAALGVKIEVHPEIGARFSEFSATIESSPQIVIISVGAVRPTSASWLTDMYSSKMKGTWCSTAWFHPSELDRLLDKAKETLDDEARYAIYHKIQELVVSACPTIFAYVKPLNIVMADYIQGLKFRGYVHAEYYFNEMYFQPTHH